MVSSKVSLAGTRCVYYVQYAYKSAQLQSSNYFDFVFTNLNCTFCQFRGGHGVISPHAICVWCFTHHTRLFLNISCPLDSEKSNREIEKITFGVLITH